jgi:hypothetical protein
MFPHVAKKLVRSSMGCDQDESNDDRLPSQSNVGSRLCRLFYITGISGASSAFGGSSMETG